MAGREFVGVIPGLWSLGAQYNYEGDVEIEDLDPEIVLLKSLKYYWSHNDVFFMMLSLLKYRLSPLIHVERLLKLSQSGFLSNDEIILLIAVSKKIVDLGDHRFKVVHKKLYKKKMTFKVMPKAHGAKSMVKLKGPEESLLEFGVQVRTFDDLLGEKKLASIKTVIKRNNWIKMRALMGPNYRSDVTFLKCVGMGNSPSEVSRILGCDKSTASKNLRFVNEFEHLEKVLSVS